MLIAESSSRALLLLEPLIYPVSFEKSKRRIVAALCHAVLHRISIASKNIAGTFAGCGFVDHVLDKTCAILLRRIPLTETSLIVHWCSDEFGLLKTVAKGARRPKSPFAGKLDLFFDCELEFVRSKKSDLHILKDLAVSNARLGLRDSYLQTQAATYFGQLVEQVAENESPISELVDLLRRALDYLTAQKPNLRAVNHFETELAKHLGVLDPQEKISRGNSPIDRIADLGARIPKQRAELLARLS